MTTTDNKELNINVILEELAMNFDHRNCKPECMAGVVYREYYEKLLKWRKAPLLALREKAEEPVIYDSLTPVTIKVVRVTELDKALGADKENT